MILSEGVTANSFCHFGSNGGIEIGSDTILGEYVSLHSENHVFTNNGPVKEQGVVNEGIYIGSGCWLGAKVTILDGVVLGDNTVVAAGSVVKRGVYPENCLLAGVPAQIKDIYEKILVDASPFNEGYHGTTIYLRNLYREYKEDYE